MSGTRQVRAHVEARGAPALNRGASDIETAAGGREHRAWSRHGGLAVLWGAGIVTFIFLVLAVLGDQGIFKIRRLDRDRAQIELKIAAIESENALLMRQIQNLRADKKSYERAAREQLGLVKPGEIVYDFRRDPLTTGDGDEPRE